MGHDAGWRKRHTQTQPMKLVFATHNLNKLKEIQQIVPKHIEVISLDDIHFSEEIEETADTLKDNALLKARHIAKKFGMNVFADDSGLEVDALDGAPGVYSARYAGPEHNAEKNMNKLLKALESEINRKAAFKTVIALVLNDEEHIFDGVIEGEITTEKHGSSGFGYDPIFKPLGYNETFAQMNAEEKNRISHRARAVHKLVDFLEQNKG